MAIETSTSTSSSALLAAEQELNQKQKRNTAGALLLQKVRSLSAKIQEAKNNVSEHKDGEALLQDI